MSSQPWIVLEGGKVTAMLMYQGAETPERAAKVSDPVPNP